MRIAAGSSRSGEIGTIVSSGNLNRDTLQAMVYHDRLRWMVFEEGADLPPECRLCQSMDQRTVVVVDERHAGGMKGLSADRSTPENHCPHPEQRDRKSVV